MLVGQAPPSPLHPTSILFPYQAWCGGRRGCAHGFCPGMDGGMASPPHLPAFPPRPAGQPCFPPSSAPTGTPSFLSLLQPLSAAVVAEATNGPDSQEPLPLGPGSWGWGWRTGDFVSFAGPEREMLSSGVPPPPTGCLCFLPPSLSPPWASCSFQLATSVRWSSPQQARPPPCSLPLSACLLGL